MRNFVLLSSVLLGVAPATQGGAFWSTHQTSPDRRAAVATLRPVSDFAGFCGDLGQGRLPITYAAPEASACCGDKPACARLLATTILKRPRSDLRT